MAGNSFGSPWATSPVEVASKKLEWFWKLTLITFLCSEMLMMDMTLTMLLGYFLLLLIPGRMVVWLKMTSDLCVLLVWCVLQNTDLTCVLMRVVDTWKILVSIITSCSFLYLDFCKPSNELSFGRYSGSSSSYICSHWW